MIVTSLLQLLEGFVSFSHQRVHLSYVQGIDAAQFDTLLAKLEPLQPVTLYTSGIVGLTQGSDSLRISILWPQPLNDLRHCLFVHPPLFVNQTEPAVH